MRGATGGVESVGAASGTAAGKGSILTATKINFSDLINDVNMFPYVRWV